MKDFDRWNNKKKKVEIKSRLSFNVGEVWMSNLGLNIGVEEDGKGEDFLRPILIMVKFNSDFFIGVPLSNTGKEGDYYFKFNFKNMISNGLISQLKTFDAKRLKYRMGKVNAIALNMIKEKIRNLFS